MITISKGQTCSAIGYFACFGLFVSCASPEQVRVLKPSDLEKHVQTLASDEYEGRGAGYSGEAMAAKYIATQFADIGLRPIMKEEEGWQAYIQTFQMQTIKGPNPWQVLQSQNVVGVLPGKDPEAGYIVIGAHYDGQGMTGQAALGRDISEGDQDFEVAAGDVIWNSAVDNAVSVSAILEIAKSISSFPKQLRRSIVFVAFGAEESALDGSTYFANNPIAEMGSLKAMINLEKIVGDLDAPFLYVSYGTSSVFPNITKSVVAATGIDLEPFYPGVIANTDHYPFILSGVPAVTIGTGSYQNVHTPADHAENLDYSLLAKRTEFIMQYLIELSNIEDEFVFTGDISGKFGASGGEATTEEKRQRNFHGANAFKISTVVNNSLADNAGLQPADLIIAVDGKAVQKQEFYQGLEDIFAEDNLCAEKELTVVRAKEKLKLKLKPSC